MAEAIVSRPGRRPVVTASAQPDSYEAATDLPTIVRTVAGVLAMRNRFAVKQRVRGIWIGALLVAASFGMALPHAAAAAGLVIIAPRGWRDGDARQPDFQR